jgi:N-sulfoglucosamine sulfohydrolase
MTPRLLILALIAFLSSPTLGAPKNILLFVADDLGREVLGCYGNPVIKTPHLDSLAREGTRFTSAFCTTASCTASRSVILSGVHNHRTGLYGHEHDFHHFRAFESLRTLPVMLAEAGYRTARAGKYHVAPEEVFKFQQVLPPNNSNRLQKFIEEDPTKPFFLYFCTNEPHRPFAHDPEDRVDPKSVIVPDWLPDTPECRGELALYYASTRRVDKAIGRLIDVLKKTKAYDDTLVLFISDNGAPFPGSKTNLYEPGMRLPCLLKLPKPAKPEHVNDAMISWLDITPTLLDFAGATPPPPPPRQPQPARPRGSTVATAPDMQGRSFLSIVEQDHPTGWDEIHASHTFHEITMYYPMRVVRTRTHKLIWNIAHPLPFPFASDLHDSRTWQGALQRNLATLGRRPVSEYLRRPRFELYDLKSDPGEIRNLADDARHAELLADLQSKMKQFQHQTDDPWVLKWDYE